MDFDLGKLTKGQLRKLNALKKSIGDRLGEITFSKWLKQQPKKAAKVVDSGAEKLVEVITPLVMDKKVRIPKTGYFIKRGRGRVIVMAALRPAKTVRKAKKK